MLKRLKEKCRPENMMFKLIILNCGLLLVVTTILTLTGNVIYQNSIEEYSSANTMETQNQVLKSLDLIFQSVSDNIELLGKNPSVQNYMQVDAEREQGKRVELESQVREILAGYSQCYKEYLNIVIVSEKGQYLSNDSYRVQKRPLSAEDWYQEAVDAKGEMVLNTTSFGRNLRSWKNYSVDSFISVAKQVSKEETREILGVILVDLDLKSIQNLVEDITMGQTGFGYIQDDHGKVVFAPKNKIVYRMDPKWFTEEKSGQVSCRIGGDKYKVIYSRSDYTDLIAVGVFDWGKTIEGAVQVRKVSVWIAVLTGAFAAACSVVFSASFTKPISNLSRLMKKAQTGDLSVHFDNHYKGEIRQLGDSFNSMVDKINELIHLVYKEQKDKRDAELKILHEQIKPHFLYNTLDTISWMAKDYHAQGIVDIVLALSNFFRISLSQGKEFITLEQEVEMVKSYLDIQKFRYEELFDYVTEFDSEVLKCQVLKLCLQPLVENALYHGIKESDREKGTIWIRGYLESPDVLILQVEDDGAGMTESQCARLNEWLATRQRDEDIKAFGTSNVNDRVKLAFGEEFGLSYTGRKDGGTIATLRIKRTC